MRTRESTAPGCTCLRPVATPVKTAIRFLLLLAMPVFLAVISPGCGGREEPPKVRLDSGGEGSSPGQEAPPAAGNRLRIAIAAMISPKETFVSYNDFVNYVGRKTGMEIVLVQRKSYEEINELLKKGLLDVAFVCTGAYVEGHDDFGMEILAAPETQGRTVYYSYLIVPAGSPVRSLEELKGRTFAFTDPMSNTGRLAPVYWLARMNQTPDRFFKSTIYTYSHDKSIEMVAKRLVDGAAVDSLVWEYMNRKDPDLTSRTRVVSKSDPFGIPPVVASRAVGPELKKRLREVFLRAHEDKEGREILSRVGIDRFVVVNDNIYDSVRAMQRWVAGNAGK